MNAHTRILATSLFAAALVSASSCVVVHNTPPAAGNVTFLWTFGGQPCALVPGVSQVAITVPGQTLSNGGVYSCVTAGTAGITLLSFAGGTYTFTIEGQNTAGTTLYSGSGTFTVNGDVTVTVDLQPVANAPGTALITWTFPANGTSSTPNCTQAGAAWVDITVDTQAPQRVACTAGYMTTGVQIQNLAAGTHTIDVAAADSSGTATPGTGFFYYRATSSVTVLAGGTVAGEFNLSWVVGTLAVKWQFSNNTLARSCAMAGITNVYVNLKDSTGTLQFPDNAGAGLQFPCVDSATTLQGAELSTYLYPGIYTVFIQAYDNGSPAALYRSNTTTPPSVQVVAGTFPTIADVTNAINVDYP